MATNFAIELLMTMKNMLGPQVAEAKAQVADLAATTTAANAEMAASTEAAAAAFTLPSVGMIAAFAVAGAAAVAFAGSIAIAGAKMYEVGERANDMRNAGYALSDAQEEAANFRTNISEAKERLDGMVTAITSGARPALSLLASAFNDVAAAAESAGKAIAKMPMGHSPSTPREMQALEAMYASGWKQRPSTAREMDYVHGPDVEDWLRTQERPPKAPRETTPKAPRIGSLNALGGAWGVYGPFQESDADALQRMMSNYRDQVEKAGSALERLNPSVARLSPTVQQIGQSVTQFAASAVTDIGHVGSAFKAMVREVLADLARQQVAKGVGSLLGALASGFGGGAGGGVVGGIKEATKASVNVHISALNARDVLRDLTSSGGEMRGAYRAIDYGSRLP